MWNFDSVIMWRESESSHGAQIILISVQISEFFLDLKLADKFPPPEQVPGGHVSPWKSTRVDTFPPDNCQVRQVPLPDKFRLEKCHNVQVPSGQVPGGPAMADKFPPDNCHGLELVRGALFLGGNYLLADLHFIHCKTSESFAKVSIWR